MTTLIDADSLPYQIGWIYREHMVPEAIPEVEKACDVAVETMLTLTKATSYIGIMVSCKSFRTTVYNVAPYKGGRQEKPDWYSYWEPVITRRLEEKWNFMMYKVPPSSLGPEADDFISYLSCGCPKDDSVMCSPDKDLRQISGWHFDYSRPDAEMEFVTPRDAKYNFWLQMLMGDTSDSIVGIPGLGKVKGRKLLDSCNNEIEWPLMVRLQYSKYYGHYYGGIIFDETKIAVSLLVPGMHYTNVFKPILDAAMEYKCYYDVELQVTA